MIVGLGNQECGVVCDVRDALQAGSAVAFRTISQRVAFAESGATGQFVREIDSPAIAPREIMELAAEVLEHVP